jgi:uridine kinase
MALDRPFLVGLAGGSGSGKTALAAAVAEALHPIAVARLAQDAYYRDRSALPAAARDELDFDVPEALDRELFVQHLRALRGGHAVRPPRYCFVTHCRQAPGERVGPADVVLVEGLWLLVDPGVRALLDLRIYLEAPERLRLSRRLSRDVAERGRTSQSVVLQYQTSTGPAHHRYVEPSKAWADLVLVNAGRLRPVAEVAATIIRTQRERPPAPRARSA